MRQQALWDAPGDDSLFVLNQHVGKELRSCKSSKVATAKIYAEITCHTLINFDELLYEQLSKLVYVLFAFQESFSCETPIGTRDASCKFTKLNF